MLAPWMVTSETWPRLTSARKSENGRLVCGPRVDELWNRLNKATSSRTITIQSARFLPKLFTSVAFHTVHAHQNPLAHHRRQRQGRETCGRPLVSHKMPRNLNNCKPATGQRAFWAKTYTKSDSRPSRIRIRPAPEGPG